MGCEALTIQGYPYLVAEADEVLLGYAYVSAYRPRAAYRDTVENSIYLRADATGQGLGSRLLGALIDACEHLPYRQMIAVIGGQTNLPSIRLHLRHGFQHVGVLRAVGYKHGQWLDTVLLQRSLGVGVGAGLYRLTSAPLMSRSPQRRRESAARVSPR